LGAKLIFDGHPYTVVGVLPAAFRLEDDQFDVFTPVGQDTSQGMQNRGAHAFRVWARPRPGASLGQAQTELTLVGQRLAKQYPDTNKGRTFVAQALKPDVGDTKQTLYLLLGAVVLVLLIACANIASLLLARAVSRGRELAMRAALGAGRGRLARQCLTESGVLAVMGGALGVTLAAIGIRPFALFWPGGLPRAQEVQLNWRVLDVYKRQVFHGRFGFLNVTCGWRGPSPLPELCSLAAKLDGRFPCGLGQRGGSAR